MSSPSVDLHAVARRITLERGFWVDPPADAIAQAQAAQEPSFAGTGVKDLSSWLWSSIDNDDSRDLDQAEYLEKTPQGWTLWIAIANVHEFVSKDSPIDRAAHQNTTSIYTGVETYPLLPGRLSFDLSSLVKDKKRFAMVTEMQINSRGALQKTQIYPAIIRNAAQLTYLGVVAWLSGSITPLSPAAQRTVAHLQASTALQDQIRQQLDLAKVLREKRLAEGSLSFETIELRPVFKEGGEIELSKHESSPSTQLIEAFMVVTNEATVDFLKTKGYPVLRRVVRTPKRWDRIVALAAMKGVSLPAEAEGQALAAFLQKERAADPERFPDLSLSIIKLLGRGEYAVASPGQNGSGHFGLGISRYSHATAPNRRYPDLVNQRLLLAAAAGRPCPYRPEELQALAVHCTEREDEAQRVERTIRKCIAAAALTPQLGKVFEAFVTGVNENGTWVRMVVPPVEGKLLTVPKGLDVGDRLKVKLTVADPWKGYIDFVPA